MRSAHGTTTHGPGAGRDVGPQKYQRGRRRAGGSTRIGQQTSLLLLPLPPAYLDTSARIGHPAHR
jgi:hypothetical protein